MPRTEHHDPIDIIDEHEEVFKTISEKVDDPCVAQRFGDQPLALLELDRDRSRGGQP